VVDVLCVLADSRLCCSEVNHLKLVRIKMRLFTCLLHTQGVDRVVDDRLALPITCSDIRGVLLLLCPPLFPQQAALLTQQPNPQTSNRAPTGLCASASHDGKLVVLQQCF
jgi:hypothetical protein